MVSWINRLWKALWICGFASSATLPPGKWDFHLLDSYSWILLLRYTASRQQSEGKSQALFPPREKGNGELYGFHIFCCLFCLVFLMFFAFVVFSRFLVVSTFFVFLFSPGFLVFSKFLCFCCFLQVFSFFVFSSFLCLCVLSKNHFSFILAPFLSELLSFLSDFKHFIRNGMKLILKKFIALMIVMFVRKTEPNLQGTKQFSYQHKLFGTTESLLMLLITASIGIVHSLWFKMFNIDIYKNNIIYIIVIVLAFLMQWFGCFATEAGNPIRRYSMENSKEKQCVIFSIKCNHIIYDSRLKYHVLRCSLNEAFFGISKNI